MVARLIGDLAGRGQEGGGDGSGRPLPVKSGFDPALKFDDIELIRRPSQGYRFGILEGQIFVSDRRYRELSMIRAILGYSLMALIFAPGKLEWANRMNYEVGNLDVYDVVRLPAYPISRELHISDDARHAPRRLWWGAVRFRGVGV